MYVWPKMYDYFSAESYQQTGLGAMMAIESVAQLASSLHKMIQSSEDNPPSFEAIKGALEEYQDVRYGRVILITKGANKFTRIEALADFSSTIISQYVLPNVGDLAESKLILFL